ncbi:MAG: heme-binding domain-containing protein [Lewinellaceae bacterium]|nr:heme-binding domain-containing protein [Saprospiraceae bacterium]MCB9305100.1 heme-binding domain-containing protein [Lewinellaceae bacterium]MCB9353379.1 heme-binding domain-containing protein [Lewinellaceae bacterium]
MNRKRLLLILLAVLVLIQFIRIDRSIPETDPKQDFAYAARPPAEVLTLIRDACYDCHSYETKYPWYSQVAPVSWWLKGHINEGREHFNFSTLGILDPHDLDGALESAAEVVREGEMPLRSYTWAHPEARLSDEQRALLAYWLDHFEPVSSSYGVK